MPSSHLIPFALLPIAMLAAGAALAQVSTAQPPLQHTPSQMVYSLHGVFGDHHARAIHAKGIMLAGRFTPAASAAAISMAPHLQTTNVPVIVRFSNFAGVPDIPDNDPLASPHGMAIRFQLPDGHDTDLVAHSFNGFPSQNADQFRELLQALAGSGPTAAKPNRLDGYLATHPSAKNSLTTPKPVPVSFATLPYYGVNTFKFINTAGKISYGRYQIIPLAGAHFLDAAQTRSAAPDYLSNEIAARDAKAPIRFKLMLQIAGKDDHIDDPSIAWPDSRRQVELGTLSLTRMIADSEAAGKKIVLMPNSLPEGIQVEDQMVNFRSSAYAVSFGQRQ